VTVSHRQLTSLKLIGPISVLNTPTEQDEEERFKIFPYGSFQTYNENQAKLK